MLDRLLETDSSSLVRAYEKKVEEIDAQKIILREKMEQGIRSRGSFQEIYRTALNFLENPQKLWVSGDLIAQKTVLKLAFDEKLRYRKNEGYRTVLTSRPFRFFRLLSADNSIMVRPNGDISNFSDVHEVINTMVEWSQILNNLQQNPLSMNAPVL